MTSTTLTPTAPHRRTRFLSFRKLPPLALVVFLLSSFFEPFIEPAFATGFPFYPGNRLSVERADQSVQGMALPSLWQFSKAVRNGNPNALVGVYVPQVLAFPVRQQPAGQAGFVSTLPEIITQFSLATQYRTIGLLAHNYLAGIRFFDIKEDQEVILIYGDGSLGYYRVETIERYRALSPNSPYSSFEDLDSPGAILSVVEMFNHVYAGGDRLVFQTCIEANGDLSWGRLFVTAYPVEKPIRISYRYSPDRLRLD